jgi:hypothetical protein
MATVINKMEQLSAMLAAPRAISLLAVAWSPWHRLSLPKLEALESTREQWSPQASVDFFALWPENDRELNRWYDELCRQQSTQFELHGHGYAPLWWLTNGIIVDCLAKPYQESLAALQTRSAAAFRGASRSAQR